MEENFTQIKSKLIYLKSINSSAFRVACLLIDKSKKGLSFPSYRTIAEELDMSSTTVQKCIDKLVEENVILKEIRMLGTGKKTSNAYLINENYLVLKPKMRELRPIDSSKYDDVVDYDWLNED